VKVNVRQLDKPSSSPRKTIQPQQTGRANNQGSLFAQTPSDYEFAKSVVFILVSFSILVSIGFGGIVFRSYALRMFSDLPTGFDGPLMFRRMYLLEQGKFLIERLPTFSFWSNGVNSQLGIFLQEIVYAGVLKIGYSLSIQPKIIHQLILTPVLIILANILLLRRWVNRPRIIDIVIVSAMVTLGTPVVITYLSGWNSPYGWILFLAITLVVMSQLNPTWKVGLILVLFMLGLSFYHTFGFFLLIYLILLWIFSSISINRVLVFSPLLLIILYFTYQMYVSSLFFSTIAGGIEDIFSLNFLVRDLIRTSGLLTTHPELVYLRYLNLILYSLLLIPISIVTVRYIRRVSRNYREQKSLNQQGTYFLKFIIDPLLGKTRISTDQESHDEFSYLSATVASAGAVLAIAFVFIIKMDITLMINRTAEYLILPALLAVITELRYQRRAYIYPLMILILSISIFTFWKQSSAAQIANYITWPEAEGYTWLSQRLDEDDVVFTDFRLSGPFIADGHFRVLGITSQGDEDTRRLLKEIYQESSARTITTAIDQIRTWEEDQPGDYLFLSTQMLNDYPGINGYGTQLGRVPPSFFQALDESPDWELIYNNTEARIYRRVAE